MHWFFTRFLKLKKPRAYDKKITDLFNIQDEKKYS